MKKQYYFLSGLPRAGNTLLGSLINQNPNVSLTAHSVVADILWQLELIKRDQTFLNFPDSKSFENVTKNVFKNIAACQELVENEDTKEDIMVKTDKPLSKIDLHTV